MSTQAEDYFQRTHKGSFWRQRGDQPLLNATRLRALGKPRGRLLDLGSGEGHFARRAADLGWAVLALDYIPAGATRSKAALRGVGHVVRASGSQLPLRAETVEVVTAWDVLEHLPEPEATLKEVGRVLHPGGLLAVSTPNPDALSVRRRGNDSIQFKDETHISIRSRGSWERAFEQAGFSVLVSGGDAWWNPPYGTLPPAIFKVASQVMFATRFSWPVDTAENSVLLGIKSKPSVETAASL